MIIDAFFSVVRFVFCAEIVIGFSYPERYRFSFVPYLLACFNILLVSRGTKAGIRTSNAQLTACIQQTLISPCKHDYHICQGNTCCILPTTRRRHSGIQNSDCNATIVLVAPWYYGRVMDVSLRYSFASRPCPACLYQFEPELSTRTFYDSLAAVVDRPYVHSSKSELGQKRSSQLTTIFDL